MLSPAALEACEMLKKKCIMVPVLVFADLEKPFDMETDASGIGLEAVLLQEQDDGKLYPVAYPSKALHRSQKGIHWSWSASPWNGAIMEQFKEYLSYKPFTVWTVTEGKFLNVLNTSENPEYPRSWHLWGITFYTASSHG